MINITQMRQIKEFAVDIDWNGSFGGKSYGNRHLFRIVDLAKELANDYEVDQSIIEAGAWLHDTNLELTIAGDTLANENKVKLFLESIGVTDEDINKIKHCIEAHDGRVKAESMEAKIVHDADTLEKMGPLGVIRETWKRSQMEWNSEKIAKHLPSHLDKRRNNIYTDKAKKKADELSQYLTDFFEMLEIQVSR